jgi:hypothetical protein
MKEKLINQRLILGCFLFKTMSSDESHSSNFATQSSCELTFVEDVSCDSGGDVKYGEKCGFVQGL